MQLLARAYPMPMTIEAIALEVGLSPGRCAHIMNVMRMANRVIRVGYWNGPCLAVIDDDLANTAIGLMLGGGAAKD